MPVMDKLKIFVVQEPVVAASCLIAGVGLFLPAVVRPILDSYGTSNEGPKTCMSDLLSLGIIFLLLFPASEDIVFCSDTYYPALLISSLNT
ncbi:hypothetical protein AAHA92_22805 [Salvia divinorum]|uniref:Uncharacterized protein n=1 Tax=Salvia divinorum TaxID=28513 RepID=A0ABD1GQC0_SALDI